jgi:hypothetical protein
MRHLAMVGWSEIEKHFVRDGALRDIYVDPTSEADWNLFLTALASWNLETDYSVDGEPAPVPSTAGEAFADSKVATVALRIKVAGAILICHFFCEEQIEIDLDPSEWNEANSNSLFGFVRRLGQAVCKNARLTHENDEERPFVVYDRVSDDWHILEVDAA